MSFDRTQSVACVTLLLCVSLLSACGANKVPNEQIDTDLGNQSLKVEGLPDTWAFNADTDRCFAIAEGNYSEGKAVITIHVASSQMDGQENMRMEDVKAIKTLLGDVVLNYKKESGKWILEKADSKSLRAKPISVADWKVTFIPIQLSLCETYKHKSLTTGQPAATPSVELPAKIVDTPSLIGKTADEVRKMIALTPKHEIKGIDNLDYEIVGANKEVLCRYTVRFDKRKFEGVSGELFRLTVDTPEKLGDLLGVDLRSSTPNSTQNGNLVFYKNFTIKGVDLHPRFSRKDSTKGYATFSLDTKY